MENFANRDCGRVEIRVLETMKLFLDAPWCNVTTFSMTGDSAYANKRGAKAIAFPNPMESTLKIEAQVVPFKLFALFSDGTIKSDAIWPFSETVKSTDASKITMTTENVVAGTVCVYAATDTGFETPLTVTVAGKEVSGTFTAATDYVIRGLKTISDNVQRIEFNNSKEVSDYFITVETTDKGESGRKIPKLLTAYKATPKRNFELAQNSTGDPVTISVEFDCLEDKDGHQLDMAQITA